LTFSAFFLVSLAVRAAELIFSWRKRKDKGEGESKLSFSKETRNCVGNKMKVTALGVLRELFRRPSDVSGFVNFVIKSNKKTSWMKKESTRVRNREDAIWKDNIYIHIITLLKEK